MADFCGSTTDTRMLRILFDSVWPSNAAVLIHNIIHRSSYCICTARTRSTQKLTQITFHFIRTVETNTYCRISLSCLFSFRINSGVVGAGTLTLSHDQ